MRRTSRRPGRVSQAVAERRLQAPVRSVRADRVYSHQQRRHDHDSQRENRDAIPLAGGEKIGGKAWGSSKVVPDNPKPRESTQVSSEEGQGDKQTQNNLLGAGNREPAAMRSCILGATISRCQGERRKEGIF
ncbi:hypothetical protein KC320_g245 [Hortaea werneckii]|nr:hypothetical protein KC320_g245 [Hortaea werneckii]